MANEAKKQGEKWPNENDEKKRRIDASIVAQIVSITRCRNNVEKMKWVSFDFKQTRERTKKKNLHKK